MINDVACHPDKLVFLDLPPESFRHDDSVGLVQEVVRLVEYCTPYRS